jgi:hypothetical protein
MKKQKASDRSAEDLSKATQQIAGHLSALGIDLKGNAEQLSEVADAVERFEEAVQSRGGDLMVDEAPRGSRGQPDDPDFALPVPASGETLMAYLGRLSAATEKVLQHPREG